MLIRTLGPEPWGPAGEAAGQWRGGRGVIMQIRRETGSLGINTAEARGRRGAQCMLGRAVRHLTASPSENDNDVNAHHNV